MAYLTGEHDWYLGQDCTKCGKPMTLEVMVKRCQAGQARWGNQPPTPLDEHQQATMSD